LVSKSPGERLALDERHDVVKDTVGIARVVDRQDVRVLQPRGNACFAQKSGRAQRRGNILAHHLDGDLALELRIVRPVDNPHPAARNLLRDLVVRY